MRKFLRERSVPSCSFCQRMAEASGKCLNCSTLQHRQHPQTNSQAHLNIASSISPPPPLPTHPPLTTPTTIHHNYKDDENSHIHVQALHPDRSGACLRDKCSKQTSSTLDSAIPSCSSSPCTQAQQRKQDSDSCDASSSLAGTLFDDGNYGWPFFLLAPVV